MDILQVLGIVSIGTVAGAAVIGRILRRRLLAAALRLQARSVGDGPPSRIHLAPVDSPRWTQPAKVHAAVRALRAAGFEEAGTFRIPELPAFLVSGLVHPGESEMAAVYEHPSFGVWTDVAVEYDDGRELTASNAPMGSELEARPGVTRLVDRTWTVEEVIERIRERREPGTLLPVSAEVFLERFEATYARDVDWRNGRGGATLEEVERVAQGMGGSHSRADLELAHDMIRLRNARKLIDELTERFAATTSLAAAEWEQIRGEVIVVHDLMSPEEVAAVCAATVEATPEDRHHLEALRRLDGKPTEVLDRFNARLPGSVRMRKLGEVVEPVRASVYLPAGVTVA